MNIFTLSLLYIFIVFVYTQLQDIFPGLSRTKVIFQDFPGPEILKKKNPGLSRRRGNPDVTHRELKLK